MVENGGSNAWILDRMEKGKEENLTFSQNQNMQGTAHNTGIVSSSINEAKNNEIVLKGSQSITQNGNRTMQNIGNQRGVVGNNQNGQIGFYNNSNGMMQQQFNGNMPDKYAIKVRVQQELAEKMKNVKGEPDDAYLMSTINMIINKISDVPDILREEIVREVIWGLRGYGIIQPLLDDESITEIMISRFDNIWIERNGILQQSDLKFSSEYELRNLIDKIIQPLGRKVDDATPYVNARLSDGSRVNIVLPPIAADGATVSIRKFSRKVFSTEDYIKFGTMVEEMADLVMWLIMLRKNIMVSGGTGSGKTTILNWASRFIPPHEAIVTIEDLLELQLVQPNVRRLEARPANAEGTGAVTIRDLVINALRMRPDRMMVGESRGGEIVEMLQAANTGHDGTMSTGHANSPKELIDRMVTMYQMSGLNMPDSAIKSQIANGIHGILQVQRLNTGERKMMNVTEVLGYGRRGAEKNNKYVAKYKLDPKFLIKNPDDNEVYLQDIYKYDKLKKCFVRTGWIPTYLDELQSVGAPFTKEDFSEKEFR